MDLADLPLFLAVTRQGTLQRAAAEVHLTPSALSRAVRRLEEALKTPLFDRSGRALKLNAEGERLRQRAQALMDLAEQTRAEFRGVQHRIHCRIAAPAMLAWLHTDALVAALGACGAQASLALPPVYEDEALAQLARGEVELALVTDAALSQGPNKQLAEGFERIDAGTLTMKLACAASHPLATKRNLSVRAALQADFVAPSRSPFCGLSRVQGSDGWRDDQLPRRVRYWVDDLQVLVDLVQRGNALAYLPEPVIARCGLSMLKLSDCPFVCEEQSWLLWRPSDASGWLRRFVDEFSRPHR